MKKLFISIFVFVAIVSFGGNIASVHAQSLTPAQTAVFQQTLDSLRAQLLNLQAQAAAQASSPMISGAPLTLQATPQASTLSAEDMASVKTALVALSSALSGLQSAIANNPQLAATNAQGISQALTGIGNTLAAVGTTLGGMNIASAAPIAPAAPVAIAQPAPSVTPTAPFPPTPSAAEVQPLLSANNSANNGQIAPTQETAQAASFWSIKNLNWPLVIVIILVIAAIALWLFWPGEDDAKDEKVKKSVPIAPSPIRSTPITQPMIVTSTARPVTPSPTPLASTMTTPTQQTNPQYPQHQQRKPA